MLLMLTSFSLYSWFLKGQTETVCLCVCVRVHRFDSEQSQAQEEVQKERSQREKLSREKDILTGEVFSLRQQLEVSSLSHPTSHPLLSHLLRCNT